MIEFVRRGQIVKLLETRDDHLPQPTRRDHAAAGFVHNAVVRETCADCLANDRTMFGCETCGGRGYVETLRRTDPYAVEKVQPYGMSRDRHEKRRERDSELRRLEAQTAPPWTSEADALADANLHPYRWEIDRDRKWADYDYAALDAALEQLRQHDEGAYRLVHSVYVYGWLESSTVMEAAVERGLRFLDAHMPDPIRAPGDEPSVAKDSLWRGREERHRHARELRVERVLRAHFEWGWSTVQIAAHESLTDRRVRQIVAAHNAECGDDAAVASGPAA
ncbi:MAG TPA: hypothetical protein VIL92_06155 [Gaiellaceae bacterium]